MSDKQEALLVVKDLHKAFGELDVLSCMRNEIHK